MFRRKSPIFRKAALERLSSPEKLDQLVEVVDRRGSIALVALASLIAVAFAWSVVGSLPTTVTGRGVLVRPRKVVDLQAAAIGRLVLLNVRVGDAIEKGAVVGIIEQAELRQDLQQEQLRLAELQAQEREKHGLQLARSRLQAEEIAEEKRFIQLQRLNRQKKIADAEALTPILKQRIESRRELKARGLLPKVSDDLLDAEQAYLQHEAALADFRAELKELESQWLQVGSRERILAQEDFEASSTRKNEIQGLEARIALLEVQLDKGSRIISEYPGRVLEVAANVGQVLNHGQRLGSLEVDDSDIQPAAVLYFQVKDGKRIHSGMPVQITPDTVQRERFGSIVGTVRTVSPFPVTKAGAASSIGNAEVADSLVAEGPQIEIVADLERDASTLSGYRWSSSSGPPMRITSGLTATARVKVEGRAPITYILPFLRSTVGVY